MENPLAPACVCYTPGICSVFTSLNMFSFTPVCWIKCWFSVSVSSIRYRTFVSEDAGPNTLVATVLAKDPDGDGITYKITSGNEEGNFVIDSQKGRSVGKLYLDLKTSNQKLLCSDKWILVVCNLVLKMIPSFKKDQKMNSYIVNRQETFINVNIV